MRLEFEPNTSAVPFVEKDIINHNPAPEVEKMLREGVKAAQDGNRNEARTLLLRVTETDADNENAWLWLASISEYPEELLVFLNNVLRVNPHNERALEWHKATKSLLAKTLVQRGVDAMNDERRDFARQCFEQAVQHEAENETAWLWMASVADSEDERISCFEKVLSLDPANETAQASLKAIQSQKTQKLFQDALVVAFNGNHHQAKEMLAGVLSQDENFEDALILKAHLAESFEERAECLLKLRAVNADNEMANACLASWRMLADKRAAVVEPPAEVVFQRAEENAPVVAGFSNGEFVESEKTGETAESEEVSVEFSENSFDESFAEPPVEQKAEDFSNEAQTAYFEQPEAVEEESFVAENAAKEDFQNDRPTQQWRFVPDFEQDFEQPEAVNFNEPTAENSDEQSQENEVKFEVEENPVFSQEFDSFQNDLAAETEAEEAEMHLAFGDSDENEEVAESFNAPYEEEDIHATQPADIHATEAANYEAAGYSEDFSDDAEMKVESAESFAETKAETPEVEESEEWRDTSPGVFENYSSNEVESSFEARTEAENSFEAETETEIETEAAEQPAPELFAADAEEEESALELPDENDVSQQFAENSEESSSAETDPFEEQVPMEAAAEEEEEIALPQPPEETKRPRAEMMLCPFCNAENEKQAFACGACQTILTLSDLEMLLSQQSADQEKLQQSVASLERENEAYGLNAEQLANLGIGHINLKNSRQGFNYLQEAVRLNPNNVLLEAQVNALAIRLSEIEEQQSIHDSMAKNRKILVVDDSPTVRKLISGKLEKCGHEVVCAVDGIDALEKIKELTPDLVLLDITMPRKDGYQVCKEIRTNEATKDVPVVMISGKDGFFDKVRGKMAGTTGYITKPFGPETLMKTVETYLN